MLVITADQISSTTRPSLARPTCDQLNQELGDRLPLLVDTNAGDEIQAIAPDGAVALQIILTLARQAQWSIGLGIGEVAHPLPEFTREAHGTAFVAARRAVDRAKRNSARFAVEEAFPVTDDNSDFPTAADLQACFNLLFALRARRSAEGWQIYDRMAEGRSQNDMARELGISPQAVSARAHSSAVRLELPAQHALQRMIDAVDLKRTA